MTRTKAHAAEPRFFTKSGHFETDPRSVKKNGAGKGNWGSAGAEWEELVPGTQMTHARRRSNSHSSLDRPGAIPSKWDTNEIYEDVILEESKQWATNPDGTDVGSQPSNPN